MTSQSSILKNWQASFAIAQQRLGNSKFQDEIQLSTEILGQSIQLSAKASGYTVQILETGYNLIQLEIQLNGELRSPQKTISFNDARWQITTSFETFQVDNTHVVRPKLDDPNISFNLFSHNMKKDEEAAIITLLEKWVISKIGSNPFKLFSFTTNIGNTAQVHFSDFQVTSAYAKYSPEYSSFLLMMREDKLPLVEGDLVIDPHILPTGQTAVLWVSKYLLEKTGETALVNACEQELTFRPRPMNVDILNVSSPISNWSKTIIDNVSLPDELNFTSMELQESGLMLSATPLSIEELDSFTARDITKSPDDLVQKEAEKLFQDCVYYYMKDEYRNYLLNSEKPVLPKEVKEVTEKSASWYEQFARLQLAQAIKNSDSSKHDPFKGLSKKSIDEKLKEMCTSTVYADQTGKLYSLAFCLVHPRISLYMESPEEWKKFYREYIVSDKYAQKLINSDQPSIILHEDVSKLALFDLSGETSRQTQNEVMSVVSYKIAHDNWQILVRDEPKLVEAALSESLQKVYDYAVSAIKDNEGIVNQPGAEFLSAEETSSKESSEEIVDAIDASGGVSNLVAEILVALQTTALTQGYIPLDRSLTKLEKFTTWVGKPAIINTLKGVASIAVLAALFVGSRNALDTEGLSSEEIAKQRFQLAVSIAAGIRASGELVILAFKGVVALNRSYDLLSLFGPMALSRASTFIQHGAVRLVAKSAAILFRIAGGFLVLGSAILSIWDAVDDFRGGKVMAGMVDVALAAVAILEGAAIVLAWTGPIALVLAGIGLILALIRVFAFNDDEDENQQQAANNLSNEFHTDGIFAPA